MNIEPGFSQEALETAVPADDDPALVRRRKLIIIGALAILAAVLVFWMLRGSGEPAAAPEPPPRVTVIVPGATQDPNSFAGPPRGVSQLVVVLLVTIALMAGFFLGFAVAKQM